eukprot:GHVU01108709.1.p1 GENE.GHVU01108709.1~~GHVU01108709.1.p1  ORF type:complete len:375 (-),score=47.41 GHVU01108709.1:110-1234(-)
MNEGGSDPEGLPRDGQSRQSGGDDDVEMEGKRTDAIVAITEFEPSQEEGGNMRQCDNYSSTAPMPLVGGGEGSPTDHLGGEGGSGTGEPDEDGGSNQADHSNSRSRGTSPSSSDDQPGGGATSSAVSGGLGGEEGGNGMVEVENVVEEVPHHLDIPGLPKPMDDELEFIIKGYAKIWRGEAPMPVGENRVYSPWKTVDGVSFRILCFVRRLGELRERDRADQGGTLDAFVEVRPAGHEDTLSGTASGGEDEDAGTRGRGEDPDDNTNSSAPQDGGASISNCHGSPVASIAPQFQDWIFPQMHYWIAGVNVAKPQETKWNRDRHSFAYNESDRGWWGHIKENELRTGEYFTPDHDLIVRAGVRPRGVESKSGKRE